MDHEAILTATGIVDTATSSIGLKIAKIISYIFIIAEAAKIILDLIAAVSFFDRTGDTEDWAPLLLGVTCGGAALFLAHHFVTWRIKKLDGDDSDALANLFISLMFSTARFLIEDNTSIVMMWTVDGAFDREETGDVLLVYAAILNGVLAFLFVLSIMMDSVSDACNMTGCELLFDAPCQLFLGLVGGLIFYVAPVGFVTVSAIILAGADLSIHDTWEDIFDTIEGPFPLKGEDRHPYQLIYIVSLVVGGIVMCICFVVTLQTLCFTSHKSNNNSDENSKKDEDGNDNDLENDNNKEVGADGSNHSKVVSKKADGSHDEKEEG